MMKTADPRPRPWQLACVITLALPVLLCRADDKSIFDFKGDRATPATKGAASQPAAKAPKASGGDLSGNAEAKPPIATSMWLAADDFVVDVYVNGKPVPTDSRELKAEIFGAQVERVYVDLREGDWVVFNVACNQLRWNGAHFFGCAGMLDDDHMAFQSESKSGRWLACDDPRDVPRFLAERDAGAERKATAIDKPWKRGEEELRKHVPAFTGEGVWGTGHGTWIKYVVKGD